MLSPAHWNTGMGLWSEWIIYRLLWHQLTFFLSVNKQHMQLLSLWPSPGSYKLCILNVAPVTTHLLVILHTLYIQHRTSLCHSWLLSNDIQLLVLLTGNYIVLKPRILKLSTVYGSVNVATCLLFFSFIIFWHSSSRSGPARLQYVFYSGLHKVFFLLLKGNKVWLDDDDNDGVLYTSLPKACDTCLLAI